MHHRDVVGALGEKGSFFWRLQSFAWRSPEAGVAIWEL